MAETETLQQETQGPEASELLPLGAGADSAPGGEAEAAAVSAGDEPDDELTKRYMDERQRLDILRGQVSDLEADVAELELEIAELSAAGKSAGAGKKREALNRKTWALQGHRSGLELLERRHRDTADAHSKREAESKAADLRRFYVIFFRQYLKTAEDVDRAVNQLLAAVETHRRAGTVISKMGIIHETATLHRLYGTASPESAGLLERVLAAVAVTHGITVPRLEGEAMRAQEVIPAHGSFGAAEAAFVMKLAVALGIDPTELEDQ